MRIGDLVERRSNGKMGLVLDIQGHPSHYESSITVWSPDSDLEISRVKRLLLRIVDTHIPEKV